MNLAGMQNFGCVGVFLFIITSNLLAQKTVGTDVNVDFLSGKNFQSLHAFVTGNEVSYPAIELNSDQKITIQFDEIASHADDYYYQLIHCKADWSSSELFADEFITGFETNPINEYDYSINTTVSYVNYRVTLPNSDIGFKISGNYIFRVFKNTNPDSILVSKRFVVYETIASVDAKVVRPIGSGLSETSQEIELKVQLHQFIVSDPNKDLKVYILQNNRPDRMIRTINPVFVNNQEISYSIPGQIIFKGSNEFRIFSFPNINRMGLNINDVQFVNGMYHVQLRLDKLRADENYFWEEEMNGKFIINIQNMTDSYRSADYGWVYFSLPFPEPILDGKIFVFGAFTGWRYHPDYQMQYNFEKQIYETVLFLKQGYYNYMYTLVDNYTFQADESRFEGTHYQTENDYVIYLFYHPQGQSYDRLVGYRVINSKY